MDMRIFGLLNGDKVQARQAMGGSWPKGCSSLL